jgi:chromosome segregation ATPase
MKLLKKTTQKVDNTVDLQVSATNDKIRSINVMNKKMAEIEQTMKTKQEELMKSHASFVRSLDGEIEMKRKELTTMFEPLEEKEKKLLLVQAYVDDKETVLKQKERELDAKETQLNNTQSILESKELYIQNSLNDVQLLQTEVEANRLQVIEMERRAKESITSQIADIEQRNAEIKLIERKLSEAVAQLDAREIIIDEKLKQLDKERKAINKLKARYAKGR